MLSVLIPTYNYSITELLDALQAQITQLQQPVTVVICDDASTQISIANQNKIHAQQLGFTYLANNTNLGRTATRNFLANSATTDWLLFLDADILPEQSTFLVNYIDAIKQQYDAVFGGITYGDRPKKEELLRWVYGKTRESKSVDQRNKHAYFIISQNLCITKSMFLSCNTYTQNAYGLDILFSNNLKQNKAKVLHINNPVIHLGLETSQAFIKKTLQGINTTVQLEKQGLLASDLRPIQRVYLRLKKLRLTGLFLALSKLFKSVILKNLNSTKPSMRMFDCYRLAHLIQAHKND